MILKSLTINDNILSVPLFHLCLINNSCIVLVKVLHLSSLSFSMRILKCELPHYMWKILGSVHFRVSYQFQTQKVEFCRNLVISFMWEIPILT